MSHPIPLRNALTTASVYKFRVMPVHGPLEFGGCTCGKTDCPSAGKHPSISEWQKRASLDKEEIVKLFIGANDDYNYGIATGPESGIFVLDIDGAIGEASLIKLQEEHGQLPLTLTAKTGSGGRHLFFAYPDRKVYGRTSKLGENLDVRGEGGQVVGPGSNHASGRKYEWVNPLEGVMDAPEWLLDIVCASTVKTEKSVSLDISNKPVLHLHDSEWSNDDIKDMLSYINPDSNYDDWYQIGMALHSYGVSFSIWDQWSQAGSKYVQGETIAKWNSFKSSGVTIGSLVHHAKQGGWKPQSRVAYSPPSAPPVIIDKCPQKEHFDEKTGEIIGTSAPPEFERKERKIKYVFSKDIKPSLENNTFVQGMFGRGQMSVVYGESNCGKTFFMTDIAFHVALGNQWRNRRVDKGGVIYVALEGSFGLSNRIFAFKKENMILQDNMPLAVVPNQVDFLDPRGNIAEFIEVVEEIKEQVGEVKLIVIDTLARAMAGGDENSGQDMSMLVRHADVIRAHTGAHVCFIHHSGKDSAKGARGHSSLRAAVDTEIEISRKEGDDFSVIKSVKQRDMEISEDMYFGLKTVELGPDNYGEMVTSCVVIEKDEPMKRDKIVELTPIQQFVYDAVLFQIGETGVEKTVIKNAPKQISITYDELYLRLEEMGYKPVKDGASLKSSTLAARVSLKEKGKINFNSKDIWLVQND